ncbi:signal peptide peptidase SppA [Anaplasma phagocytophilum]|uniref:Signal peptide peptidase SppA, 36K type n=1 Tax=Anaplasma phagocytophilum str. CRT38 TaxID=1269275 RepID=S6G6H9_ANAPH|nr:signal peptide peptidase SppA [Anaplasma phagocytophilum]EOA63071.1 signal peptide peptidase SppA, 36K type [Anaplasma phagocytophilum str. CRT38]
MFDHLLKIEALASRVSMWRALFFVVLGLLVVFASQVDYSRFSFADIAGGAGGYVARIGIEGTIGRNKDRTALLSRVEDDSSIKAVVLRIDSPGGTVGDSEELYRQVRAIAEKKPVVAVMGNVAASGGYMAALAADHVIANNGTITGSIGVLTQYVGVARIAERLGITLKTIKTSELKASMSPLEEMSKNSENVMHELIKDFHRFFVSMVAERRGLSEEEAYKIADGRVYTGAQALQVKLVDELGGEREALEWLKSHHNIDTEKVVVRDLEYQSRLSLMGGLRMLLESYKQPLYALLFE